MKQQLYVIYDTAADVHTMPYVFKNDKVAIRQFSGIVNGEQEHLYKSHPDQFELLCIGTYDDEDASLTIKTIDSLGEEKEELRRYVCNLQEINKEETVR
jgi:hypothetical protein